MTVAERGELLGDPVVDLAGQPLALLDGGQRAHLVEGSAVSSRMLCASSSRIRSAMDARSRGSGASARSTPIIRDPRGAGRRRAGAAPTPVPRPRRRRAPSRSSTGRPRRAPGAGARSRLPAVAQRGEETAVHPDEDGGATRTVASCTVASICEARLTGSRPAESRRATVRSWVSSRRADSYDGVGHGQGRLADLSQPGAERARAEAGEQPGREDLRAGLEPLDLGDSRQGEDGGEPASAGHDGEPDEAPGDAREQGRHHQVRQQDQTAGRGRRDHQAGDSASTRPPRSPQLGHQRHVHRGHRDRRHATRLKSASPSRDSSVRPRTAAMQKTRLARVSRSSRFKLHGSRRRRR